MPISWRYPVIEVVTSLAVIGTYLIWDLSVTFIAFAYLAFISVVLLVIDLDTKTLPRTLIYPSYAIGAVLLAASAVAGGDLWALARAGIGFLALGGFYGLMWLVYPAGMGYGDVRTAGLLGMYGGFLGWAELAVGWFAGPMLGGLIVLAGMVARRVSRKTAIPYGPALITGAWVGYLAGSTLFSSYVGALTG